MLCQRVKRAELKPGEALEVLKLRRDDASGDEVNKRAI